MDGKRKASGCSVLLFVLMVQISWSHGAVDTIKRGQSVRDGETLVSAGGVFELGFFSPVSTNNRYLGIWYKQISVRTLVWVANREDPLTDATGFLTITDGGSLVLEDPRLGVIHVLFIPPSQANSSSATLLDSGNFLLWNEVGEVVWQSFDYPTDTLLTGMKLGFDRQTGRKCSLTSWTSPEDPASGSYSLALDTNEGSQLIIRRRDGSIYWSSGLWNGEFFSSVPEIFALGHINNFSFLVNQTMNYFIYSYDHSIPSRLVMGSDGKIMLMVWWKQTENWNLFWALPSDECGLYNSCGANACCNISALVACKCLEGFENDLSRYQQSSLWQRRCVRRKKLTCGDGDEFLRIESVRFPDRSLYEGDTSQISRSDCEYRCRSNCSCTGYASTYSNGSRGCLFWTGDLIDLRFSPPSDSGYDGNISAVNKSVGNFYVRVAAYDLDKKKRWIKVVIGVMASGMSMFITCILFYLCWRIKHKRTGTNASESKKLLDPNNLSDGLMEGRDLPFFSFAAVETATDNFSIANKLGQGGFGPVYKGKLADGREIAVKRLSRSSGQGLEEFKNEVMVISKLQHRNLVRLLGWCVHGEEKILIYEYMPHKSLDSFLFGLCS